MARYILLMKTTTKTLSTKEVNAIIARATKAAAKYGPMAGTSRALELATKGLTNEQRLQVGRAYMAARMAAR